MLTITTDQKTLLFLFFILPETGKRTDAVLSVLRSLRTRFSDVRSWCRKGGGEGAGGTGRQRQVVQGQMDIW